MSALEQIPTELSRERLLGIVQAAEFLGLSVPHLRRLYRAKKIPNPIRIGERKYGWRLGQLIEFVAAKSNTKAAA